MRNAKPKKNIRSLSDGRWLSKVHRPSSRGRDRRINKLSTRRNKATRNVGEAKHLLAALSNTLLSQPVPKVRNISSNWIYRKLKKKTIATRRKS